MTKQVPVIIVGGGGHAKVVADALRLQGENIIGVLDPRECLLQDIPWLGCDEVISRYATHEVVLANGLGSTHSTLQRNKVFDRFCHLGYHFINVIHPSAIIALDSQLGEGSQVMAGAVIQAGARVGCNVIVNTRAVIDHDCVIGNNVHIAPGVTLSGEIIVGNCSHIGTGATVVQGIEIGTHCVVGAGTLVLKNVPDNCRVVGVPGIISKI